MFGVFRKIRIWWLLRRTGQEIACLANLAELISRFDGISGSIFQPALDTLHTDFKNHVAKLDKINASLDRLKK